eukprot:TRINITY_DN31143_c0_g1_i1.p1 TRINITY_DN31143_c0_g1~~TRINITY_DN31143_c0_g1_i1.p1  ORF type:complete len:234 (-),score=26.86 TRINITY_DN31143_c0_g1_i1:134-835(-)
MATKTKGGATYGKVTDDDPSQTSGIQRRNKKSSDGDSEDESQLSERELAKKRWVKRLNWVWIKLNAAFWVGAACGMIYYTNFFRVIWESPLVNKTYFYMALACLGFNMSLLGYLAIWCASIKGIEDPWETEHPKAIPAMAVVGFLTMCLFFFAFWRVWGFSTLLIQLLLFLGFINSGHFLPSGTPGAILMFCIFFGAWFTSEMIPHEGLAHYTPRPSVLDSQSGNFNDFKSLP